MDLKSNMDRFIGFILIFKVKFNWNLKSNMDRFIAEKYFLYLQVDELFKIQYG